jgi:phenylacetyl-CoA:acceptor oxidoreductase subunit 2
LLLAAVLPDLGAAVRPMALTLVVLAATRSWTWQRYFNALVSEGVPTRTLEIFTACLRWFFAGGLVLPVVLVAVGLVLPAADAALFALAGFSVFATGWAIKFILITRAAYNQGFALPHTPIRGSGVPGPAVKPGWTLP